MVPLSAFLGFDVWSGAIFLYIYFTLASEDSDTRRKTLVVSFLGGLGVYLIANFLSLGLGFRGKMEIEDYGASRLMSLLGLAVNRINFPLSAGPTAFGPIAGMFSCIGICLLISGRTAILRIVGALSTVAGFAGVFLVDSRTAFVCVPLVIAIAHMSVRRVALRAVLVKSPFIIPFVPVFLVGFIKLIQTAGIASLFQRDGTFAQKLGLASGRDDIWIIVLRTLSDFDPIHLIGYGVWGQVISGISREYSWIFSQVMTTSASTHNASFQVVLDMGYIGLGAWIFLLYRLLKASSSNLHASIGSTLPFVFWSLALYFILTGIFDVSTTFYQSDSFPIFLGLISCQIAFGYRAERQDACDASGRLATNLR
jgi:hypothetical protein